MCGLRVAIACCCSVTALLFCVNLGLAQSLWDDWFDDSGVADMAFEIQTELRTFLQDEYEERFGGENYLLPWDAFQDVNTSLSFSQLKPALIGAWEGAFGQSPPFHDGPGFLDYAAEDPAGATLIASLAISALA